MIMIMITEAKSHRLQLMATRNLS